MYFALTCTAGVGTVRIISLLYKGSKIDVISYRDRRVEIKSFQKGTTLHPVPEKWVALGEGVNLKMKFVGFFDEER